MDQRAILDVLSEKLRGGAITRRQFAQAAVFFGIGAAAHPSLAAAAPGPRRVTSPALRQEAGEVRFLIAEAFWADWHQYLSTAQSQRRLGAQLFDTLIQIESDDFATFGPGLAESWTQIDELTWEFVLRSDVSFHNGQPFTGADVKASIELATGATAEATTTASRFVPTTVEVVADLTVRLTTATPFAPMLNELSRLAILSAADIQPSADPATPSAGIDALKAFPNGTGPFRLVDDQVNVKSMEANPDYWGGAPAISRLVWEYIQDGQTRLNAFLAGQADAIDRVAPEQALAIQADPDLTQISVTGFENVNLWMRRDAPAPWDVTGVKLREAAAWGIDRQALVTSLVGGASEVALSHVPNNAVYAQAQEPAYTFDPDRAKAALTEAGFPDGAELPLWGVTGFLPRGDEVAEAVAASLGEVGFQVQLQVTDINAMIDGLFSESKPGVFFHLSWSSNGDPHGALATLYYTGSVWNGTASDATIDDLIDRGASTTDFDARGQVYAELQAYLWQNVVHIPLYNSDFTVAHNNRVQGIIVLPNFDTIFKTASLAES